MPVLHHDDPRGLGHAVAEQLKHRIVAGTLGAGEKLPSETGLCRDYGVSRTVVREAVAQLRAEGLVETFQGRGSYVAATAPAAGDRGGSLAGTPRETMELRLAVECEASALAARRRSAVDLAAIGRAMEELREAAGQGRPVVTEDFALHMAVAAASGNSLLAGVLQDLGPAAILRQRAGLDSSEVLAPGHGSLFVHEHEQICEAVRQGDPEAARAAMYTHLSRSLRALGESSRTL